MQQQIATALTGLTARQSKRGHQPGTTDQRHLHRFKKSELAHHTVAA
jgi:hypothetical protein